MRPYCILRGVSALFCAAMASVLILGAAQAQTDSKPASSPPLARGYTREFRHERVRLSKSQLSRFLKAGKDASINPTTGEREITTFADHLPAGWIFERDVAVDPTARVDSLGHLIVNDTPGLPAWSQIDVDALRDAVRSWRDQFAAARRARKPTELVAEQEGILGNFIGQAITRSIPIDDIVNLDDASIMTPRVAQSVIDYMHFYENVRFDHQDLFNYTYAPTQYPDRIAAFAIHHGTTLASIQMLEQAPPEGRGGQPSGCYARTTFARGMTLLSGQTDIWAANGFDDEQADIPTGFPMFYFYDCEDRDNNANVRVSTNGYLSFFEQGGGALVGTSFGNDVIPFDEDPDGYIAPWWDDLIVATSQGNADRVSYKTEGTIDLRVFTVEWFSISRLGGSATDWHFFQAKLYETTDVVELHYSLDWSSDSIDSATCGLENYSGLGGDCGPNCLNSNATPPSNDYRFTPSPRPTNDNCANAEVVFPGAVLDGDLHRATPDGNATCGSSSNNRDVWYAVTAICNGVMRVNTCGSRSFSGPATGIDTVLSAHTACPGTTANQIACSDDAGSAGCDTVDSLISVPMTVGQTVYVRVTHFGDAAFRMASGQFKIDFDSLPTTPSPFDNCSAAVNVTNGSTVAGSLTCASNDGQSDCGSSANNNDVWMSFTAPFAGRLIADACGSRNIAGANTGPDTVMSIHSGCPGTIANQIACNDDGFQAGCSTLDSSVAAILTSGQQVKIRVSHFGSSAFRFGNGQFIAHINFACVADFNHNNLVNSQDFFDFLSAFFSSNSSADINLDGNINSQDFFDFLTSFFGGC